MVGARANILDGSIIEIIDQQVRAIEDAIDRVPDFAFDLAKTLVESVCKTILEDIGHPADPKWDAPRIMKETTTFLSMLPPGHPNAAKARDSITKTLNGLHTTVQGLCELRKDYGLSSHGRDGFSARLDLRQATLAAQAADTIVSFLYRIHRDALMQTPGARDLLRRPRRLQRSLRPRKRDDPSWATWSFCPVECCSMWTGRHIGSR